MSITKLFMLEKLQMESPDIVVIERPPVVRDVETLINLSEIIGCVRGWAVLNRAEYEELRPTEWRKMVHPVGEILPKRRKELKQWDIEKVKNIFNIIPENDDIADAILIGQAWVNQCCRDEIFA